MIKKASPFILFLVFHVAAGILNFNSYLMGKPAVWYQQAISWIYISVALGTLWFSKGNKRILIFYVVFSAVFLFSSVFTMLANMEVMTAADFTFAIPFSALTIAPLYGIEAAFSGNYFLTGIALGLFGLIWLSVSVALFSEMKRGKNDK